MLVTRRHFFYGSLAAASAFAAKKKAAPVRPSVLILMVDELPAWILGCYGNTEIHTPNLDRLAQTGTRFQNHFVTIPSPGPSRATILTGRTPMQLGASGEISSADVPLDKILGGLGYGSHASSSAEDATGFLDQQSAGKPFLLTVSYSSLQPPYDVPRKYTDLCANLKFDTYLADEPAPNARKEKDLLKDRVANLRKVAAAVAAIDDSIGSILAKVSQRQLVDTTIVILTGTCGACYGRHGLWDSADGSDPVNMFDDVVRTPLIWSWPGHVPAQGNPVAMVSAYDLVPTLCDITDTEAPNRNLCGRSYQLIVTGKPLPKKQRWRTTVFAHYQDTDLAREERYKLVLRNGGKGPNELYDMVADPNEKANQYDNDQYANNRTSLGTDLNSWKAKYSG